jgi:hypothetical protein
MAGGVDVAALSSDTANYPCRSDVETLDIAVTNNIKEMKYGN